MEGREMAYNPTTWGSNDVITKDRLNKMEQGIVSASKLSGTDIDTDKDWNGKNITNVGAVTANAVGVASPELTVSSNFVDVPGTTLRKTIPFSVQVYTDNQWNTLLSFTIPANYSSNYDSNCRILIARQTSSRIAHTVTVRALRNGVEIGSGSAPRDNNTVTVNTTGGFRAGDEIVLEGKCAESEHSIHDRYYTLSNCRIQSSRRADLPILAHFVEEGW
jgi:hypothetical protein